jgi:hypothetical protein
MTKRGPLRHRSTLFSWDTEYQGEAPSLSPIHSGLYDDYADIQNTEGGISLPEKKCESFDVSARFPICYLDANSHTLGDLE